ncbi:MAG TPA: nickel-dependent lactate racemase [Pyrinomonadaceae bacterium]|jgi:nickel-dependent lactate racemase|nr:nickel-dependent lactate racemase [Pyrinomonadaceae bacterium]
MTTIELGYGRTSIPFTFDPERFAVLAPPATHAHALTDAEINAAFDAPIVSPPLDDLITADDSVLIVCSDATRATGSAQIINLLVRRLIEEGIAASDIGIIFATGIHRGVRPAEKIELLTSFIAQRIRTIDHDASDATQLVQVGTMPGGAPIEINRALTEYAKVIVTGAIGFHYFAGFSGGRKSICPGLASARTIAATHMLALDFDRGGRRQGVGAGLLDGNAVSEACERVAEIINPAFSINAIVDEQGRVEKIFAGHWRAAHRRACDDYVASHSTRVADKREVVIVSCGGAPYDINMIQAHKALDMAAQACADGGTIIFLAECGDGLGRADFMKWFDAPDSRALERRLRVGYEVNGQTAWTLLMKTERFRVHIITDLPEEQTRAMRMTKINSIDEALAHVPDDSSGYIMPRGAALLPVTESLEGSGGIKI